MLFYLVAQRSFFCYRTPAQRRTRNHQALDHYVAQIERDFVAMRSRNVDKPSIHSQQFQVLREVITANHIENDIDTITRPFLRAGKPIFLAVIKGPLCAQRNAELALCRRASRGDNTSSKILRHLNRRRANAARTAMHQEAIASNEPGPREQI